MGVWNNYCPHFPLTFCMGKTYVNASTCEIKIDLVNHNNVSCVLIEFLKG